MNLLFFIESGHGNIRYLADQLISINKNTPLRVHAVLSNKDLEAGISKDVERSGISYLCLKGLHDHIDFIDHKKILYEYVCQNSIDIIHVHTNWQLALVTMAFFLKKHKPKVIYTINAYRNNESFIKRFIAKYLIFFSLSLFADKVFANCKSVYDEFKLLGRKISILNLGIDERYLQNKFIFPSSNISIIFPAIFREGKRHELILNAVSKYIIDTLDDSIRVCLPGDGPLLEYYKKKSLDLGLSNIVSFPGMCSKEHLINFYNNSNVLVCSSVSETYCQSLVEGYCMGKYVITTPVGIASELIISGENGIVFTNENELVDALKKIVNHISDIKELCQENYQKRYRYSWNSLVLDYYKQIINNNDSKN